MKTHASLKFLLGSVLCLVLAGCFQTSLTGTTGDTTVTVTLLRPPGTVVGEQVITRTEADWIEALGEDTWTSFSRLAQLLFLGSSSPSTADWNIDADSFYLLTAEGGEDYFSQATAIDPGAPEPVGGAWHAIVSGDRLLEGNVQISVLTEAVYRQAAGRLNQLSNVELRQQLDAAARLLVSDVDNNDSVDYDDVVAWNPRLHGREYLGDIFAQEALADGIRANQPAASLDTLAQEVLGSRRVVMETNYGSVIMDTLNWEAPITVDNFLQYVEAGFYANVLFHRVINNFVIQAGLVEYVQADNSLVLKEDEEIRGPIRNESRWSISNARGTVAMARTNDPDSATSQFYINQVNNAFLDFGSEDAPDGYTVFARLVTGLAVVDEMAAVPTFALNPSFQSVPQTPVYIESMTLED